MKIPMIYLVLNKSAKRFQ